MQQIRKAGEILRRVDNEYADTVVDWFMGKKGTKPEGGIKGAVKGMGASYLGGTRWDERGDRGAESVMPGAAYVSQAARIGVPVAALGGTAAIVGGTTNAIFGGPEDGQQPGQLDLGGLTVASLLGAGVPTTVMAANNLYQRHGGESFIPQRAQDVMGQGVLSRNRIGASAAAAGLSVLGNALQQAIF